MAAAKGEPRKKRYEVKNWSEYNEALVNRGDFAFWFSEEVVDAWEHENEAKKNGRPFTYSDLAIETLLTIRELFRLPYWQTEGFGKALAKLMNAGVAIPHHTSLVKRGAKLKVSIDIDLAKGPIDVVVDSTGLKVFGDGEWRRKKHGVDKRRTFRKVHLAVDPDSHAIVAQLLTESNVHDGDAVEPLLEQVEQEVTTFYGDGAYDQWKVRERLQEERIHQIIPPRKNAVIQQHGNSKKDPLERDECVRQIRRDGKKSWKESIGYHRRSLAETAMSRMKGAFGDRLKNREPPNQATELALRCKLLNAFVAIGMPLSIWG
ncbi:IS5 family transposase [Botrimarina mediterranea]|uniref:IS5 family transposase n=1 Tax=Botrimarina mediterranea TaxID=2528022 RepID=UPI00118B0875|nr:Transposase DDE domain protein [Planctomycetes bacterium K2D]